jgi:hypothetical protein
MAEQEVPASLRRDDWRERLAALVEKHRYTPFKWGEFDCASWGGMCVYAVCGITPKKTVRPRATELEAQKQLRSYGGIEKAICSEMGSAVSPKQARHGDICLVEIDGRMSIGVCLGAEIAAPSEQGLAFVPLSKAVLAWHI